MELKAKEIARIINGKITGNPNIAISSFANIKDAKKGDITFLSDKKYLKYIPSTKASLIIIPLKKIQTTITTIAVKDPVLEFSKILKILQPENETSAVISQKTNIDKSARIGKNVTIGDFCIIRKDVIIGDNCIISPNTFVDYNVEIKKNCHIGPNVSIYSNSKIGEKCIIHAGVVIGSHGFGFVTNKNTISKMPQVGKVIIKNNVEIGSNTTIDRGTLNDTIIEDNVKLDNLIQIGHNVHIGKNTIIAAQSGIAGSSQIGSNCMIGGQVAISNHIKIGNNVKIAGKSGVIKNLTDNEVVQGPLAFDLKTFQKAYIHFKNLNHIVQELEKIKKQTSVSKNNKK